MDNTDFIFLDVAGKRWSRVKLVTVVIAFVAAVSVVIFFRALFIKPPIYLPQSILQMKDRIRAEQKKLPDTHHYTTKKTWQNFVSVNQRNDTKSPFEYKQAVAAKGKNELSRVVMGFYVGWDHNSLSSLKRHAHQLTHVCPEWLSIVDSTGRLKEEEWDENFLKVVHESHLALMPLLNNLKGEFWQPEAVEGLAIADPKSKEAFFAKIVQKLESVGATGLVVDWGQLDPAKKDDITLLLKGLADALHKKDMEIWLCVPMGLELKAYDLNELSNTIDHFVAMFQDENAEYDEPGPIASPQWLEGWSETIASYGRPEQWIIGLGVYGYDWPRDEAVGMDTAVASLRNEKNKAQLITFKDAMARAIKANIKTLETGPPFYQPHFAYEDNGMSHEVWFSDAISFLYQARLVNEKLKNSGIAITFLGAEDPAIWEAIHFIDAEPLDPIQLDSLQAIPSGDFVANVGLGEFLTVEWEQMDGLREVFIKDGQPGAVYKTIPKYLTLYHQPPISSDQVAITFDDGPDPKWTPRILDILKRYDVKATFFVLGAKVEENPGLLRRIREEGHEIGIHSYTHPDMYNASDERIILELNASQRLIETITGHSTILFRPPYSDCMPHTSSELKPFKIAQELGYLTVAYTIDTEDWARPGVENILKRVRQQRREGNVVLMHDAGGNREQTVEALPLIIEYLRKRGDRIVPLSEMLNIPDKQLMPEVQVQHKGVVNIISAVGFWAYHWIDEFLWAFIVLSTLLVILRIGMILFFAQRYRPSAHKNVVAMPPVSVILPAYNEEKVIANTLKALLASDYSGDMEILVVNDGSTDRTAEVVAEIAGSHPRVRLINQKNQGKSIAIRKGLESARNEFVVMLDADTLFEPGTVRQLVLPMLEDAYIGAVAGHAKVGNRNNLITKFQDMEYTCSFNLDRRAYDVLNCITVVPGAVCAVRKSAVMLAGGISMDTLAEDTDLTLALHKAGYKIRYMSSAVAWTEAPETVKALIKQRIRWVYGTLQCLWKHRDMLFDKKYKALGWFALPSIWFYHIFLAAIGPFLDLLFFKSLFGAANGAIYFYFIAFTLLEIALVVMAIKKEKGSFSQLWVLLPMRFTYRYILAVVVWRSIIRALKGVWLGWGKLERTASVMPQTAANMQLSQG